MRFLAFFEAKMTKIVILDQKVIVPNDYLQVWVYFEWFYIIFSNFGCKTVQAKSMQKWYF